MTVRDDERREDTASTTVEVVEPAPPPSTGGTRTPGTVGDAPPASLAPLSMLARRLGLGGSRHVGRVRLRLPVLLAATVTDAERRRTAPSRAARVRR